MTAEQARLLSKEADYKKEAFNHVLKFIDDSIKESCIFNKYNILITEDEIDNIIFYGNEVKYTINDPFEMYFDRIKEHYEKLGFKVRKINTVHMYRDDTIEICWKQELTEK